MLKITKTYTDYDGVERTEDLYFNLSKAELMDMELTTKGGYSEKLNSIIKAKNQEEMIKIFKTLLNLSYGKKSEDGRRFIKSAELTEEFQQLPVYSDIYYELITDEQKAIEFVNGILPADIKAEADKISNKIIDGTASLENTNA